MRTEKELWELVLSGQDFFEDGVCTWIELMCDLDIITYDEFAFLKNSLYENKPKDKCRAYFWQSGELQSRIDWINERIKQLEEQWK
jgi:hypothetical protein